MALILCIESATKNCSVALFTDGKLISKKEEVSLNYSHAEQLNVFIVEVLSSANISMQQLDVIAVSKGPGSYTGLRIGVSTAKGLCYSLGVPLIAIDTLQSMAFAMAQKNNDAALFCPMIDARRMEVFAAIFDNNSIEVRGVQADIVNEHTYAEFSESKILFFGDGAMKCKGVINNKKAKFIEGVFPSAINMGKLAFDKFSNNDFEDVAYFEPFYLKDFVAGKKKD